MANKNTFTLIDIENEIARYKLGYISESECLSSIATLTKRLPWKDTI